MIRNTLFAFAMLILVGAALAETVRSIIPLDQIWASNMPGTRSIDSTTHDEAATILPDILRALATRPPDPDGAKPGFAVLGTNEESLRAAHAAIVDGKVPHQLFPAGRDVSLVFFSHQLGSYVHIQEVHRDGSRIEIQYRFVPHRTREVTAHFAMIPLGKLPVGKYTVEILQKHRGETRGPKNWELRVCKSFEFSVEEHHAD
jgi:hypothetical protein